MAARSATLAVKITGDAGDAAAALDDVGRKAGGFQSGLNKAAAGAAVAGTALVAFGKQAFDAASSAQQAAGAVDAAFGASADAIHKFAETSAETVGLSSGDYEAMAATFGASLKNMGVAAEDLAPTTNDLVSLGADLAAQYGGSTSDAVEALGSLLRGETDPIEKYGVSIKAADIAAQKAEMGLSGLTGEADKQATTQATLALLTKQTADATGAFAREADTAAGQQQRANAQFEDAAAAIGEALLPAVSAVASALGKMAGFAEKNKGVFTALGFALAGVAATILGVKAATLAWTAAQAIAKAATVAWTAVQWLLNAAMTANPIGLIVAGIAALIAAIVLLVKNWDTVVAAFKAAFNWLKTKWPALLTIIAGPFGLAVAAIIKHRDKILDVIRKVFDVAKAVFAKVKDAAVAAWRAIRDTAKAVFGAVGDAVKRARDVAVGAFRAARDAGRAAFNAVRDVARAVASAIAGAFRTARDVLKTAFNAVRDVAKAVFGAIRDVARTIAGAIADAFRTARDALKTAFNAVRDTAKAVFGAIRDAIQWPIDKATALRDYLSNTLKPVFNTVKDASNTAWNAMTAPIEAVVNVIESVINLLNNIPVPHIDWPSPPSWVPIIGGKSAPAPAVNTGRFAAPAVGALGAGGSTRAGAGGVTINVTGALDPDAVARQINRLLTSRSRRVGGVNRAAGVL